MLLHIDSLVYWYIKEVPFTTSFIVIRENLIVIQSFAFLLNILQEVDCLPGRAFLSAASNNIGIVRCLLNLEIRYVAQISVLLMLQMETSTDGASCASKSSNIAHAALHNPAEPFSVRSCKITSLPGRLSAHWYIYRYRVS